MTEFIKIPIKWYKNFLIKTNPEVNIDDLLKRLIITDRVRKLEEKSLNDEDLIEIKQELWNFFVRK